MNDDIVLEVKNVSKKFCTSLRRTILYAFYDVMDNLNPFAKDNLNSPVELRLNEFIVLDNINFTLKRGDHLAIIGKNGSGKTTLLRLIYGIYPFDRGEISYRGRMGALLGAGVGFHPHMTGRENVYVNGAILGMKKKEIDQKFKSILEFAEIGNFIDAPSATYSSGMLARLGFSIAVHADVDILVTDEVLSVGDKSFKDRCNNKINELKAKGTTIIVVSHAAESLKETCNKALYLEKGKMIAFGDLEEVLALYEPK